MHTVVANNRGEVLILQRSKHDDVLPGYWDIPGGTLEDGEDPAQGAIREIQEETGLVISDVRLFFQKSNVDTSKNKQFVTLVFHTKTSTTDVIVSPEDHDAHAWINPSKIGDYETVDSLVDCLRAYEKLKDNA